jgi:hypothetical protein
MPLEHSADADKHRRSKRALLRLLPVLRNEGHPKKYRALKVFCQGLQHENRSSALPANVFAIPPFILKNGVAEI